MSNAHKRNSQKINKSQNRCLYFVISSAFSQIFCIKSHDVIDNCRMLFNCQPVTDSMSRRKGTFLCKYISSNDVICSLFVNTAADVGAKLQWYQIK